MSEIVYRKVPFVWEEPQPIATVPSRLKFIPASAIEPTVLLSVVADVMANSIDAGDRSQVAQHGFEQAAKQFLEQSKDGFFYQNDWWQVGIDRHEKIVGFVFPAAFAGCTKNNLEEGTIYYIGILPEHRVFGFAQDLLLQGTQTLQKIGVWRIFCDTDVNNLPMISTFQRVGYQQYSEPYDRPL